MKQTINAIFFLLFIFLSTGYIQAYELAVGNYKLNIDESTGKVNIHQGSTLIINESQLSFIVDKTTYTLTSGTATSTQLNDKFGNGTLVTFCGVVNEWNVNQYFYLYPERNYILTDFTVEASTEVASNYMAPIKTSGTYSFLAPGEKNRVLQVPFDNDEFIRYESKNLSGNTTSHEITALYNDNSRLGLILGSVEHDTWKTGIRSNISVVDVKTIEIFGGHTSYNTRDQLSGSLKAHGSIKAKKIKSPKVFIGFYDDWRDGMEDFGKANRIQTPKYYDWEGSWNGKKPFGWNSWAALSSSINYDNTNGSGQWMKENLQDYGFESEDGTMYVGLDSYWNESGFNDTSLRRFVINCHARGQKAGVYLVPFSHWGGDAPDYALKVNGKPVRLDGGWCIDPTHPGTLNRVENEFLKRIKRAGFDYIKMDFMGHGAIEADSWYDPNVQTGMQAYNQGMKWLADWYKENIPHMYVNLSIAPLFPGNYAHSRRISCDAWNKMYSSNLSEGTTEYVLNALTYGWWLDNVYDYNDADHILLEGVSEGENKARITSAIITGIFILGDNYSESGNKSMKERSKYLLTRGELNRVARQTKAFRPVYSGVSKRATNQFMTKVADTTYVAVFNYGDRQSLEINFQKLGLDVGQEYNVRDLWTDKSTVQRTDSWTEAVPNKNVRLLKIFKGDPTSGLEEGAEAPTNFFKVGDRIEAEDSRVSLSGGGLGVVTDMDASGGYYVNNIWRGDLVSFDILSEAQGKYKLHIRYVAQDRGANFLINGVATSDYTFESTDSWNFDKAKTKEIEIDLEAGLNSIGIRGPQKGTNEWGPDVDYFEVKGNISSLDRFPHYNSLIVRDNGIDIQAATTTPYQIMNLTGQIIEQGVVNESKYIPLVQGIYLVKIAATVHKVRIR